MACAAPASCARDRARTAVVGDRDGREASAIVGHVHGPQPRERVAPQHRCNVFGNAQVVGKRYLLDKNGMGKTWSSQLGVSRELGALLSIEIDSYGLEPLLAHRTLDTLLLEGLDGGRVGGNVVQVEAEEDGYAQENWHEEH